MYTWPPRGAPGVFEFQVMFGPKEAGDLLAGWAHRLDDVLGHSQLMRLKHNINISINFCLWKLPSAGKEGRQRNIVGHLHCSRWYVLQV
jgi:hypothetical protein